MKSKLFSAVMLLVVVGTALAAGAQTVTFRTLSVSGTVEGVFYTGAEGRTVELRAKDYVRSPFLKSAAGQPLEVFRLLPPEAPGKEPRREVLGRLAWPVGNGPFLVLISKTGERYGFSVAADDEQSFPMSSFRVINASKFSVTVRAGDKIAVAAPQEAVLLKPVPAGEGKGTLFQVTAKLDSPKLVYSNIWSSSPTTRTLVFIVNRDNPAHPVGVKRLYESDLVLKYAREMDKEER